MNADKNNNLDAMTGLVLETSASCQLQCGHCFRRSYPERPDTEIMSLQVVRAVLPYIPELESIDLTGWGEPLINPHIFEIIKLIRERFSGTLTMTTNGLLLDKDKIEKIVDLGLDTLCVSVDAAGRRSYQAVRPGGDFTRLQRALDELATQVDMAGTGRPKLFATFLLRKDALPQLGDFVGMISAHGFDGVVFQQLTGVFSEEGLDQATHSAYYCNDFDEAALQEAVESARAAAPDGFVLVGPETVKFKRQGDCGGFDISRAFITSAGQISVCCAMAYPCALLRRDGKLEKTKPVVYGDVRVTPLTKIWIGPAYTKTRAEIRAGAIPGACGDCIALYMKPGEVWNSSR